MEGSDRGSGGKGGIDPSLLAKGQRIEQGSDKYIAQRALEVFKNIY